MNEKSAILFITYEDNENVRKHFNKIKQDISNNDNIDLYCIYDISRSNVSDDSPLNYNLIKINKQIIQDAGYGMHYYFGNNSIDFYGHNIELIHLYFYKTHPDYKFYWIIEYDVVFTGNWCDLLKIDSCVKTDYICSNIKIRNIHANMKVNYKTYQPKLQNIHVFNPIFRMSNRAFKLISDLYNEGNWGFYEHFYPSTILHFNYTMTTVNDLGYVDGISKNECLPDMSMSYILRFDENKLNLKNILYHPIK